MQPRARYDKKLLRILEESAAIFAEKGYHRASIRDISAATGVSLSGLYYYFRSKEELLFLIQSHCYDALADGLEEGLESEEDPMRRLSVFVRNHLRFFVANRREMKVLSHEDEVLGGEFHNVVAEKKRRYTERASELLAAVRPEGGVGVRTATFALFGMMNWLHTWYRPGRDPAVEELADDVTRLFLEGFLSSAPPEAAATADPETDPAGSLWGSR